MEEGKEERKIFLRKGGLGKADGVPSRGWLAELGVFQALLASGGCVHCPLPTAQGTEKEAQIQNRNRVKQGWTYQKRLELRQQDR